MHQPVCISLLPSLVNQPCPCLTKPAVGPSNLGPIRSPQAPLQPLQDNLESQTYETFEKDVTKYACYQEAVRRALLDRVPPEAADSTVTTLMVVGAGEHSCKGRAAAGQLLSCLCSNATRLQTWAVLILRSAHQL